MTTLSRPAHSRGPTSTEQDRPPSGSGAGSSFGYRAVDVLRIFLGFTFLWPFLDKTFGLGYSTSGSKSWISGGSPTKGFLGHVEQGPLQGVFRSFAGAGWADVLFMLGLLGIGVALLAGVGLRFAAACGTVLLVLMWAAEWPLARFTSTGDPTSSVNPFLDYHLLYASALWVVAAFGAASTWGLGRWWAHRSVVESHSMLR